MKCIKCSANIVLANSKFCPECGTKIEALPITPAIRKTFVGVKSLDLKVGTDFKIMPSTTNETTIIIDGSEEIKHGLTMTNTDGVLEISGPSGSFNVSVNSYSGSRGGLTITGNIFANTVVKGSVKNNDIANKVTVNIMTPRGVDVSIDSSGNIHCEIGDLQSIIEIDTSGFCYLHAVRIEGLDMETSGSINALIDQLDGNCSLESSGSCILTVSSGEINKLNIDSSGSTTLDVKADTSKANIDVSGRLSGFLKAKKVTKDVSGRDNLVISH